MLLSHFHETSFIGNPFIDRKDERGKCYKTEKTMSNESGSRQN